MKKEFEEIRKSKYFKYIVAFGIIKKVILLVMFLVPLLSFSQIIIDKKIGEINIETLSDKYITIKLDDVFSHMLSTSNYKGIPLKRGRQKRWNVYDNGKKIALVDKMDILNFFSKYGYELATSETESTPVNYGNGFIGAYHQNTITLIKVNQ